MAETKIEVHDELSKQASKLRYLAEAEDKEGLSELLLDIASNISVIKFAKCLIIEEEDGDKNVDD